MRISGICAALTSLSLLAPTFEAAAQEDPSAADEAPAQSNAERRAGHYEMTLTINPTRCFTQAIGGTARGVVEVRAGRRNSLIVDLSKLNSLFAGPVAIRIKDDSLAFAGAVPVSVAGIRMDASGRLSGAFERGRERFRAEFELPVRLCTITGTIEGLKTVAPAPAPPPATVETPTGALLNSDGYVAAPPAEPAAPQPIPPSPLINGNYSTTLTVTESRCFTQDLRGSWQRNIELMPQPGIRIPLQEYSSIFAEPVILLVQGLQLSQRTQIRLSAGPVSDSVPATFDGTFTNDASRFNVRFEAGNSLCRIAGTIEGMRL